MSRVLLGVVLLVAIVGSGIAVAYERYRHRQLFVELEALKTQRDDLNIEWGQLMLEQATWATPTRVELIARQRLGNGLFYQILCRIDEDATWLSANHLDPPAGWRDGLC